MAADVTVKTVLLTGAFYEPWLNSGQDPVRFCVANSASRLCGSNSSLNGRQFSAASLSKSGSIRYEYSATFFFYRFLAVEDYVTADSTAYNSRAVSCIYGSLRITNKKSYTAVKTTTDALFR